MVFAGAADRVTALPAPATSLAVDGRFAVGLAEEPDNLVLRAARAFGASARLRLEKNLPVASGIGGGSADAAATLRVCARLGTGAPDQARQLALAVELGADVPVCLESRPRRMQGVGDILLDAPLLPACGIALINPGVALATAAVFRARAQGVSAEAALPGAWEDAKAMASDLRRLANDLEAPARALCPPVGDALAALAGSGSCLLARMSGSGATCFGLFETASAAARAAAAIGRREPGWWCWGGGLHAAAAEPITRRAAGA